MLVVRRFLVVLGMIVYASATTTQATGVVTVSPPDNNGQEFVLMFMENTQLGTKVFPLELYVTTQEKRDVHVHVTSPKWSTPKIDQTITVSDGQVKKITVDAALRMTGSNVSSKALLITADGDVACYGANKATLSNDVYLGLPTDALGTDYYAVVHSPASVNSEIGIASTADNTHVKVTLPSNNGAVYVTFKGQTYHKGETINVNLGKYDTLEIQSKGDLTGAHIESDKPVAVQSGNVKTNIGTGTPQDHLVEMLVPSDRWGKQFVTAPIPGRTVGDVFRIVAKEDNTVVTIPGKAPITLSKGDNHVFELPSSSYNSITSTKPIQLAQFVKSQQNGNEPADPSMMIILPYEQFGSDYTFATPEYSHPEYGPTFRYVNEFMIVAKKSETTGLLLDGKPFHQTTWHDIPGTDLVGGYVTLDHGVHTVRHSNPLSMFGGYLYGHAYHESYGFPTGMRTAIIYDPNCKVTPSVAGDGIDNDCDNKIDEELCTPDNLGKDDDGDGRKDEDCVKTTPIDGLWGSWGPWGSTYSVTCGDGVVQRSRKCDAPEPKFGGKKCTGNSTDTKSCYGGAPCGRSLVAGNAAAVTPGVTASYAHSSITASKVVGPSGTRTGDTLTLRTPSMRTTSVSSSTSASSTPGTKLTQVSDDIRATATISSGMASSGTVASTNTGLATIPSRSDTESKIEKDNHVNMCMIICLIMAAVMVLVFLIWIVCRQMKSTTDGQLNNQQPMERNMVRPMAVNGVGHT